MKTNDLTDTALDWAVAKADGDLHPKGEVRLLDGKLFSIVPGGYETRDLWYSYSPSTDWAQGGPIIEQQMIELHRAGAYSEHFWKATRNAVEAYGPAPLIAAMRCLVACELGDEVEVPEELL